MSPASPARPPGPAGPASPAPSLDEAARRIRAGLDARPRRTLVLDGFRDAAVLVPLLDRPGGPTLLLTQRASGVQHHKDQIAFPGGGRDAGEDEIAAALREAHEEVGLPAEAVEVLGLLDDLPSTSSYRVSPVVGLVRRPPAAFHAQAGEVFEPFEVPLATLLDRSRLRVEWWEPRRDWGLPPDTLAALRERSGDYDAATGRFRVYFFDVGRGPGGEVWGLTARVVVDLLQRSFGY